MMLCSVGDVGEVIVEVVGVADVRGGGDEGCVVSVGRGI